MKCALLFGMLSFDATEKYRSLKQDYSQMWLENNQYSFSIHTTPHNTATKPFPLKSTNQVLSSLGQSPCRENKHYSYHFTDVIEESEVLK